MEKIGAESSFVEDDGKKRNKKEKGYAQLERGSSEEELVSKWSVGKTKKSGKMFGKLHGPKGKEKEKKRPGSPTAKRKYKPVIGVALEEAVKISKCHDGVPIPAFLRRCIDYIEERGLTTEGIYRISPPKSSLEELKDAVNHGFSFKLHDPHTPASLIKHFLRELPDHVLTSNLLHQFEKAASECPCKTPVCTCLSGDRIHALLKRLPPANYYLLGFFFIHVQNIIKREEYNKMSLTSIGLVLQPTLSMSQRLLTILIRNARVHQKQATSLFQDVPFKKYVAPLRIPLERLAQQLPTSRKDIEEELQKQQSLLESLHEEIADLRALGNENQVKEQELWEVQMVATQLKRRLKVLRSKDPHEEVPEESGPCIELFEEKQVLAVQTELKERIQLEKKLIEQLEKEIREKEAVGWVEVKEEDEEEDEGGAADWKEKSVELERANERLLAEIIEERHRCARIRAEIELITNTLDLGPPKNSTGPQLGSLIS